MLSFPVLYAVDLLKFNPKKIKKEHFVLHRIIVGIFLSKENRRGKKVLHLGKSPPARFI